MNPNVTVNRSVEAVESLQWIGDEETDVHQEWNTIQANVRRQKGPSFSAASGAVAAVSARAGCPWRPSGGKSASCRVDDLRRDAFSPHVRRSRLQFVRGAHLPRLLCRNGPRDPGSRTPRSGHRIVAFVKLLASITFGLVVDTISFFLITRSNRARQRFNWSANSESKVMRPFICILTLTSIANWSDERFGVKQRAV